jgi:hypothetical protein
VPYPIHLVSEWIEAIVAAFFLAATAFLGQRELTSRKVLIGIALGLLCTIFLTRVSEAQERSGTPERIACAEAEVRALLDDMLTGGATTEKLFNFTSPTHRRVFLAENRGYLDPTRFQKFNATHCTGSASTEADVRHRYAVDPWGLSYWIFFVPRSDGSANLTVYSFGPDRRRDSDEGRPGHSRSKDDDDISATGVLVNKSVTPAGDDMNPVFSLDP